MPKVSIVLPTYNGEKYIKKSIDSIIAQTFEDWELIIVNDCSNDNTLTIICEYAVIDDRIRVINNDENQKLPKSLNIGFREARGMYLTWTSDDNIYQPKAIGRMVDYLDHSTDVMVCAGMCNIDGEGKVSFEWPPYDEDFMFFHDAVGACFLYRRQVLEKVGEYDSSMFLVEDYEYWLRILTKCGKIGYLDENLYLYRSHKGSLTETRKEEVRSQRLKLRKRYSKEIINRFKQKPSYLTRVYLDFLLEQKTEYDGVCRDFCKVLPELMMLKVYTNERKIIAYGAGNIGNQAFSLLGDNLELYIDSNADYYQFEKNGRKVIFPDEISNYVDGHEILLSVYEDKVYDILMVLKEKGIKKCLVSRWL